MRAGFLARLIDCLQSTLIPGQPGIFFLYPMRYFALSTEETRLATFRCVNEFLTKQDRDAFMALSKDAKAITEAEAVAMLGGANFFEFRRENIQYMRATISHKAK